MDIVDIIDVLIRHGQPIPRTVGSGFDSQAGHRCRGYK